MNKIIKQIFLLSIFILSMGSCNEEAEYYTLETPPDQMNITASTDNVILQKIDETEEAIKFSWENATDRGAGTKLAYYFRLYHSEMKDLQSELIKIDEGVNSITLTVRELNNLLHAWEIIPGDEATIEAEVLAVVESSLQYMKPEISKTKFNVVGYDPSNKLYLTIETDGQKRNIEMNAVGNGVFNWKGELDPCEFWFVRNSEKGFPAYVKGADENSLVYSNSGEGEHFEADRLGNYDITANLNDLTITVSMSPINRLYLVTSKNGVETVTALNEAEIGTDIFYLKGEFEIGTEFRFVRKQDALWPAYTKGADNTKLELKTEGAEMFKVTQTATYVMTVNMVDLSLIFLDVYVSPTGVIAVVGGTVTSAGWDAGAAIKNCPLTQKDLINRPEVISYTGNFNYNPSGADDDNSFKFVGDKDWGNALFATEAYANPFDVDKQTAVARNQNDGGDLKWKLPSGTESGIYTLEMNLHTMKINLIKQ